jgi:multicomponent K+:H+ antiporter subunit E
MTRWLPFPRLTAVLLLAWLLLNESLTPGALLLAVLMASGAACALTALDLPSTAVRRPLAALRLALDVMLEIVRSNYAVAGIILNPRARARTSGFVRIPLDMRNPYGLATLACIITATPGTIWVEYDAVNSAVLLHVLDLVDEEQWVRTVKDRYERRLMEIFQ